MQPGLDHMKLGLPSLQKWGGSTDPQDFALHPNSASEAGQAQKKFSAFKMLHSGEEGFCLSSPLDCITVELDTTSALPVSTVIIGLVFRLGIGDG